jgi:hypothetical protein
VAVAPDTVALLAQHQGNLDVGLQPDDAVDRVAAGILQQARALDVRLLVEASLELDEHDDLLAAACGIGQRPHDRVAHARGTVERVLDGQHVGVIRRLAHESLYR